MKTIEKTVKTQKSADKNFIGFCTASKKKNVTCTFTVVEAVTLANILKYW